jgi:hypothetical protein
MRFTLSRNCRVEHSNARRQGGQFVRPPMTVTALGFRFVFPLVDGKNAGRLQ